MRKILVTGADGFLGKEVIEIIKQNNFDFISVSKKNSGKNYELCNLSSPADVYKLLEKTQPDVIINLAATVDFKKRKIKHFYPVNVLLPAILGNYCQKKKSYLVHCSGIIVHGFSHKLYNINTSITPDTGYGKSKLFADNLIVGSGCVNSILRKNGPTHLSINKAISGSMKGIVPSVVGRGNAKRNYIYVKDAAQAIVKCFEQRITGIHYLGGEIKTINGMINDICEVFISDRQPNRIEGEEATDQIIENSDHFIITPFRTALEKLV